MPSRTSRDLGCRFNQATKVSSIGGISTLAMFDSIAGSFQPGQ
jgi:hypothetical protein